MIIPTFVKRVVKTCLRIGQDDKVVIFTWRHVLDLAEAFAMECKRAGAHTHVEFWSDDMWYDGVKNLPLTYLETPDPFDLTLAGLATANIFISGPENPERMKGVPADRWMALSRADRPYYERILERKIRVAEITLGHVTPQRAKTYGFNYRAWEKNVKEAIDVEYEKMQKLGERFATTLEKSRDVNITDPDGTDLHFTLEGRKAHIHDGVINDKDIELGAIFAKLPAGNVSVAPTETSANGVLTSKVPYAQAGKLIRNISLQFKDGQVKSFEGDENFEILKDMWKKATGDKDKFGWFTVGLNPKTRLGYLNNSTVLGTVTVGIGLNKELGGKNESDWGLDVTLAKPTVTVDEDVIIRHGKLTF